MAAKPGQSSHTRWQQVWASPLMVQEVLCPLCRRLTAPGAEQQCRISSLQLSFFSQYFFFQVEQIWGRKKARLFHFVGYIPMGCCSLKNAAAWLRQAIPPTRICVCSLWVARLFSLKTPKNPNLTDKLPAGMWPFHTLSFLALHKHQNFIPLSCCHIHF